jgi:hypothetical protein
MLSRNDMTTMKTIARDEIFQNLKRFLKTKGIELQEGSYTRGIQNGCGILADTVNLSQRALVRAKTEVGKRLVRVRQAIHEKTGPAPAPQPRPTRTRAGKTRTAEPKAAAKSASARPPRRDRR